MEVLKLRSNCIEISSVIFFFNYYFFFALFGKSFAAEGTLTTTVFLTWNRARSASVDLRR